MLRKTLASIVILALIVPHVKSKSVDPPSSLQRVINGILTTVEEHSYMISFQVKNSHLCGGSLISPRCVLTAAHCVSNIIDIRDPKYSINTGSSYYSFGGLRRVLNDSFPHPEYKSGTLDMDVAILQLSDPISEEEDIEIVEIDFNRDPRRGDLVTMAGWGQTFTPEDNLGNLKPLRMVERRVMSPEMCHKDAYVTVTDNMFCTRGSGPKGGCYGDSGSPIVHRGMQVGLVSGPGSENGCIDSIMVSTRLSSYSISKFLRETIKESC